MNAVEEALKIHGWMEPEELAWLAETASGCKKIIEVGSWKGRSTKAIAMSTPGIVYCVDTWEGSESERLDSQREALTLGFNVMFGIFRANLSPEIAAGKVVPVVCDSKDAVARLVDLAGLIDMVFLDGDHEYEAVKRDIALYRPFVRPGGILCGHDYWHDHAGVIQAVNESVPMFKVAVRSIWSVLLP
jgi:predicted O-methyltransferase YrrM